MRAVIHWSLISRVSVKDALHINHMDENIERICLVLLFMLATTGVPRLSRKTKTWRPLETWSHSSMHDEFNIQIKTRIQRDLSEYTYVWHVRHHAPGTWQQVTIGHFKFTRTAEWKDLRRVGLVLGKYCSSFWDALLPLRSKACAIKTEHQNFWHGD